MGITNRNGNMLEVLVREGSFKWLLSKKSSFDDGFEEMGRSSSTSKNWITELSTIANIVVHKCSKVLGISAMNLKETFDSEAADSIKQSDCYARNLLEYCCFKALAVQSLSHVADNGPTSQLASKKFRTMTFEMMVAWEAPAAASQPSYSTDEQLTVGPGAFCRIAPAVPIIANAIISENLFQVLSMSTGCRLLFSVYDKYLIGLQRAIKKMNAHSASSLLKSFRLSTEKIVEVDGTVTGQPVLEHVGVSIWPGRLTLTDHALFFEALRVVSYDNPKVYDLSVDLRQTVRPELTGPWGTRIFDKAVLYSADSLSEPVVLEFPELKGHGRRDYWLAIIQEMLHAHRFIKKFQITGEAEDNALAIAVHGILRLQAILEISLLGSVCGRTLLVFNYCDMLPGGDFVLERLAASLSSAKEVGATSNSKSMISSLSSALGACSTDVCRATLAVGSIVVGEISSLEKALKESRNSYEKVVLARKTVDGAKVNGIDTNLAVMKELLFPVIEIGKALVSLAHWDDPLKSSLFCLVSAYIIWREWLGYAVGGMLISIGMFMVLTQWFDQGRPAVELKVVAPPPMNTMEQLLAVQNAISQVEQLIQDGNIALLKFRALLLSIFPQLFLSGWLSGFQLLIRPARVLLMPS